MKIAKWGNSLAVRIPADVVRALGLKEGDPVELKAVEPGVLEIAREDRERRKKAMETIKRLARPLPPDYKFDREEANSR